MSEPLPDLGAFDAVVSCFAIHHLEHERKRSPVAEVFERLEPGGVFANLEQVASPTEHLHRRFYVALGYAADWEDTSNRLLDVELNNSLGPLVVLLAEVVMPTPPLGVDEVERHAWFPKALQTRAGPSRPRARTVAPGSVRRS